MTHETPHEEPTNLLDELLNEKPVLQDSTIYEHGTASAA